MNNSEANIQVKTPFKRLLVSGMFGGAGVCTAQIVTSSLLLPLKLMALDQQNYTALFGYITGIAGLVALIAGPFWGALSDRTVSKFGRRRLWILVGILAGCMQLVGIGLATSVIQVGICWVLAAFFFGANWGLNPTLIADQVDESRRGTYGGITGFVTPFSTAIGMVLISLLANKSLSFKFNLIAIIGIVFVLIQVMLIKEGKMIYKKPAKDKRSFLKTISHIYPSPRKYPAFTWGLLTKLLVCTLGCLGSYNTIMLLQRFHFTPDEVSAKMSLISATSILFLATSSILGGILSDKFRKQKAFIFGSIALFIVVLIIEAFAPNFTVFYIASCAGSFAYGLFICVDQALMIRLIPDKVNPGKDMAIINLPSGLATPMVSFISPIILSFTNWKGYYLVFAVVAAVSIITVLPLPEMSPEPVEEAADLAEKVAV